MEIHEFLDTYSDDIIYLQEGRSSLLTHPLKSEVKDLCDASFCKIINNTTIRWRRYDHIHVWSPSVRERGLNNGYNGYNHCNRHP